MAFSRASLLESIVISQKSYAHLPPQNGSSPMLQDPMEKAHFDLQACPRKFQHQN